jgi:predicted ABC-type ATPase
MPAKKIVIITGPNGAGKTTFAREFLPNEAECSVFINADLIAAGLSPFEPERAAIKAGKLMLTSIKEAVNLQHSFAFETTLSGRSYLQHISDWRLQGYRVKLIFLELPSVDIALSRVAERVLQGGHNIPEAVVRRRFNAGLDNFHQYYKSCVDFWLHFENSNSVPKLIDWSDK